MQALRLKLIEFVSQDRVQENVLILALIIGMGATGSVLLDSWRYFIASVVVVGALILMVVNLRIALLLFLSFMAAYEEFVLSSDEAFHSVGIQGSIIAVKVFGLGFLDFCLVFFLLPALIKAWYEWHKHSVPLLKPFDIVLLPFVLLWVYGSIPGIFYQHSFSAFVNDVRDLGYIIVFYITVTRILTRPQDYFLAVSIILGTIFLKTFLFAWRYLSGGGYASGYDFYRALVGSDTALVGFVLTMTIALVFLLRNASRAQKIFLVSIAAYLVIVLVAGLTRSTYVLTSVALVFIVLQFRKQIKPSAYILGVTMLAGGGFFFYFGVLSETSRDLIAYSLASAFNWVEAIKLYGDMSMGQRVLELINIWETLSRSGMTFIGLGWGAAWSEVAMHHPLDQGAFPLTEQMTGIHTRAHIDAVQYLLKLGIIGMPLLYWSMYRVFLRGYRMYKSESDQRNQWTLLSCMIMIIIFTPNFIYFDRLKFLLAVAIAGIAVLSYYRSVDEKGSPRFTHFNDA